MSASWAVVATVDEPAPLVAAFVAHHLNEGAREVHVFLDRPDAEVNAVLRKMPGCILTQCNKDHWATHAKGRRPFMHTKRQILNAGLAYQRCSTDWLVHCDADEFIRDGRAMTAELAGVPADCDHLRLRVAERVMPDSTVQTTIFDGIFRMPLKDAKGRLRPIYRPVEGYLNRGLTGHVSGKGIVRSGRDFQLGLHRPKGTVPAQVIQSTRLLHFDGLTQFHFLLKVLRRAHEKVWPGPSRHSSGRLAQLAALKEKATDTAFCSDLAIALKTLRPGQIEALVALELIDLRPFAPNLGDLVLDLSVEGFDANLRKRQAGFLENIGFTGQSAAGAN